MSDEERPPVELEHVQLHSATTTSASSPAFEPPRVRSFTAPCPLQHEEQKTVKSPIETLMIDTQTEPVTETPEIQVEQVNAYAESNALSGAQEFATVEHPQVRQTGLLLQNELGDWFYWDAQGRPVLVPQVVISMNAPNAFIPGMSPLPASSPLQMDAAQNPAQEIQSQKTIYYIPPQTRNEQDPIVPGPQISFQPPAPTSPSQKKKRLSGLVASPKSQEEVPQFVYQEPPLPSVSLHPQYPQALKATQMNPESSATLIDSSVSDVLHENPKSYKESALSDILSAPSCPGQYGSGQPKRKRSRGGLWIQAFRIFNLLRAIATAIYSYKITADALNNHEMIRLGATSLLYVSFVTTTVDLIVPMIRLWPTLLWCFWDVKTWDPVSLSGFCITLKVLYLTVLIPDKVLSHLDSLGFNFGSRFAY